MMIKIIIFTCNIKNVLGHVKLKYFNNEVGCYTNDISTTFSLGGGYVHCMSLV